MTIAFPWGHYALPAKQKQTLLWGQIASGGDGSWASPIATIAKAMQTLYTWLM